MYELQRTIIVDDKGKVPLIEVKRVGHFDIYGFSQNGMYDSRRGEEVSWYLLTLMSL